MVINTQDNIMPKRVTVYTDDLQDYLQIILQELQKHEDTIDKLASKLLPPYPMVKLESVENKFHDSVLAHVVHSSLKQLHADCEANAVDHNEILKCVDEYIHMPTRNRGLWGDSQPGIQDTTFNDQMLELSRKIADYMEDNDIKVPHIRRAGVTSDKITNSIAIIYTGRLLQKELKKAPDNETIKD